MHPKPIDLAVTAPPRALSEAPDRGALTLIGPSRALPARLITLAVACRERLATTDAFHHA